MKLEIPVHFTYIDPEITRMTDRHDKLSGTRDIEIPLPRTVKAHVSWSTVEHHWVVRAIIEAYDVEGKVVGPITVQSVHPFEREPTDEQIAQSIAGLLVHEVEEQMGLRPHDKEMR